MGRKYVKERISENFVYPNNEVQEYGIEIVHDINDNSVSGTVTNFNAVLTGSNIDVSFTYSWVLNNAEPFITDDNRLSILSVHMMGPETSYYKPYRLVHEINSASTGLTGVSTSILFTVTPAEYGVTGFSYGDYYFEIRMIGHRAIFPICAEKSIPEPLPTPTPTPTPTFSGCTCESYTATNESLEAPAEVQWTSCETGEIVSNVLEPDTGIGFCACQGSVSVTSGDATIVDLGSCEPTPTPTPTPPTPTPTPTPTCGYKEWVINECTLGTCSGGLCSCQDSTRRTVYTDCSVTDITDMSTEIYEDSNLVNPFTGDFEDGAQIWSSSGSGVTLVCTIGGPC
jgi:hypothetical protein